MRLVLLSCWSVALLALPGGVHADGGRSPPRPNMVFFVVDDYDKPETSVYGGKVLTPNLDRMAREGMTFHNAHMTSTVCTPARYTCLTGRYAGSSTFPRYTGLFPEGSQGLPAFNVGLEDDNMNVGRVLAESGYATGFVGKYHVGNEYKGAAAGAAGLHDIEKNAEYTAALNRRFDANEKRYRELIKERGFTWAKNIYWGNLKAPFKGHNPEWTVQAALEFIDLHRDQPFYLYYATTLLHGPNGEWHRSLLERGKITGEGVLQKPLDVMPARSSVMKRIREAGLTESEAGYLWMDDSLGMLLDRLDEHGISDNTVVVFISDHGSDKKGSLFKSRGTEVPCLIRWPEVIPPAAVSHELIQSTDFVPTWFELARAKVPAGYRVDGVSLAPLFADPDATVRDHVYGEMGAARSIKTREWNYISLRYTTDQIRSLQSSRRARITRSLLGLRGGISRSAAHHPGAFDADQLYRLDRDPTEQKNLATDVGYADQLKRMQALLTKELQRFSDRPYGEFVPGVTRLHESPRRRSSNICARRRRPPPGRSDRGRDDRVARRGADGNRRPETEDTSFESTAPARRRHAHRPGVGSVVVEGPTRSR